MVNIIGLSQFGFSAFFSAATPPSGAVTGWTSVAAAYGDMLASVPNASSDAPEQLFNCYYFSLPSIKQGQAFLLQSLVNGKYVVASTQTIAGARRTVFTATGASRDEAARFATFTLQANVAFLWFSPDDQKWCGLINLASGNFGGTGVLAASQIAFDQPYLLPWQAVQSAAKWWFTPPGGWNVSPGSDLSHADFTSVATTEFPFDFTDCKMTQTNLAGKTFGYAKFVNCDLTLATLMPPLGATETAWIDFTRATVNFSSIGPDWRYFNLTRAVIKKFPAPPEKPPKIDARGAILDYLNMVQWNLNQADFMGAQLYNVNLTGSYLSGANFHGAKLSPVDESPSPSSSTPANLAYAYLFDADFSDANLQGVNFAYSFLYGKAATLSGASLREADFSNAFLPEIDFAGVYAKDLVGVGFDGACLASANFQGTILGKTHTKGFSFVGAALQGTDFTGSNLQGANLTNAAIAISDPPSGGNTLKITAQFRLSGITIPIQPITYTTRTILAPTDGSTYCPSNTGPCEGENLNPANPLESPQKSWPVEASIKAV